MKHYLWLLLLPLTACSDASMGPTESGSIEIEIDTRRAREVTLSAGDSVRLNVSLPLGGSGGPTLVWRSTDPSVVRLGHMAAESATIHAVQGGSSRVIAEAGALADTVLVTVLEAFGGVSDCSGPEGGVALAVGGSITMAAGATQQLCLSEHSPGAEFLVVPFLAATGSQTMLVEVVGEGIMGLPAGESAPRADLAGHARGPIDHATDFDRRLREREARDLTPLIRGAPPERGARFSVSPAPVPALNDTLVLNVNSQSTCTSPVNRRAAVTAVGDRAIVLEDVENPRGGLTAADYRTIASAFDDVVYPTVTRAFGEPTDIDGNGRVLILFTGAVNEMTAKGSESYVAGFFYARDLFPKTSTGGFQGCAGSNAAEILYLMAPDPNGAINGNRRTKDFVLERSPGVIAHELQHLINASRRLRTVGGSNWSEEFWLNEGMSHIAEELTFFAATPLAQRDNIDIGTLRGTPGVLTRFNQYQATNFARFIAFLKAPDAASPISGTDLATRGASWSFLRYVADRRGGVEEELWRTLTDSNVTGYANLMNALGTSPLAWMHDWAVSLYVDDLVPVPAAFRQPSWNARSVAPAFSSAGGSYPLKVLDLRPGAEGIVRLQLTAGGAGMIRFTAAPGAQPVIRTTSGNRTAPPELRITLMRTR